ncbi:MAG: hypothetical protein ACM3NT_11130 [Methylocystaceae bacterium]
MPKRIPGLAVILLLMFTLILPIPAWAADESPLPATTAAPGSGTDGTVIFSDDFSRPDAANAGSAWQEYMVRTSGSGYKYTGGIPTLGETPWSIKNNTLYFQATGENSYIEDFVQTVATYPVDNTRVEFEIRATAGTGLGYVGPSAFWCGEPQNRRNCHNVAAGPGLIGPECWYRWENGGTKGLLLFVSGKFQDYPTAVYGGVNEGQFVKHVITIKDGKITYESGSFPAVTLALAQPLEPGACRHFCFGARLYDTGITETIEIRNLKIASIDAQVSSSFEDKLETELSKLTADIGKQAQNEIQPLVVQVAKIVQGKIADITPKIGAQVKAAVMPQVQAEITKQQADLQPRIDAIVSEVTAQIQSQAMSSFASGPPSPEQIEALRTQAARTIQSRINAMTKDMQQQAIDQGTEQQRQLMEQLRPQINAIVQSEMDSAIPDIQKLIAPHINTVVPKMNLMVESAMPGIFTRIKPYAPDELKKLPAAQYEAKLRQEIIAEVRPQIEAEIDEQINAYINTQIESQVQQAAQQAAVSQMAAMNAEITSMVQSTIAESIPADAGEATKAEVIAEVARQAQVMMDNNKAIILSDVQNMTSVQTQRINDVMGSFARQQVTAALNTAIKSPAKPAVTKKVLKRPISIKKK